MHDVCASLANALSIDAGASFVMNDEHARHLPSACVRDELVLALRPDPAFLVTVRLPLERRTRLRRSTQTARTRVALHLETAMRPYVRPASIVHVFDRGVDAPLATWNALAAGRFGSAERDHRGARSYVLVDNAPERRAQRRLTTLEAEVVRAFSQTLSNKTIAYSLGVAEATASHALGTGAGKLGIASLTAPPRLKCVQHSSPFHPD
jgi:DNA-binding CsgD family transcriptional regulator